MVKKIWKTDKMRKSLNGCVTRVSTNCATWRQSCKLSLQLLIAFVVVGKTSGGYEKDNGWYKFGEKNERKGTILDFAVGYDPAIINT